MTKVSLAAGISFNPSIQCTTTAMGNIAVAGPSEAMVISGKGLDYFIAKKLRPQEMSVYENIT